jgi:hypothetical protein
LAAAVVVGTTARSLGEVEYRGERIKLRRWYFDYDDYKNDPDNILRSELPRVQELVRSAPAGPASGKWEDVSRAALRIKFPGYGSGSLKSDWSSLRAFQIEIPQAQEERVIVFRSDGSGWKRVDDFVISTDSFLGVENVDGSLVVDRHRRASPGCTTLRASRLDRPPNNEMKLTRSAPVAGSATLAAYLGVLCGPQAS